MGSSSHAAITDLDLFSLEAHNTTIGQHLKDPTYRTSAKKWFVLLLPAARTLLFTYWRIFKILEEM